MVSVAAAAAAGAIAFIIAKALLPHLPNWAARYVQIPDFGDFVAWVEGLGSVGVALLVYGWARALFRKLAERHRAEEARMPPAMAIPDWTVARPLELTQIVGHLLRNAPRTTVGLTTALHGVGGFGKTTVARLVCADTRIRRHYRGRIYLVTLGRDVRSSAAIAARVNDLIHLLSGETALFTDASLAGNRLGTLLDQGPPRLLVLDDVWAPEQLDPFLQGGLQCKRLVTTRIPRVLPDGALTVLIDQMTVGQARAVLTAGLPTMSTSTINSLIATSGRWPQLLRLVNRILANLVATGNDIEEAGRTLASRLEDGGPVAVDWLADPAQRVAMIRNTIEASTSLLDGGAADRLAEIAVFAEDEEVPVADVTQLWRATAGLTQLASEQVIAKLASLDLIAVNNRQPRTITMHDVIRDYLRADLVS